MEVPELDAALQQGCTVAFDTNAIPGANILPFGRAAKRLNEGRSGERRIRLVVPALVDAEHRAHLIWQYASTGRKFDPEQPARTLRQYEIEIAPFLASDAAAYAALITGRFTDREAWRREKFAVCARAVNLPDADLSRVGKNHNISATADWFIRSHVESNGWIVLTDDRGAEWQGYARKCSYNALAAALNRILPADFESRIPVRT